MRHRDAAPGDAAERTHSIRSIRGSSGGTRAQGVFHNSRRRSPNRSHPPPRAGARWHTDFIRGLIKRENEFLILLDMDRILNTDEVMLVAEAASLAKDISSA